MIVRYASARGGVPLCERNVRHGVRGSGERVREEGEGSKERWYLQHREFGGGGAPGARGGSRGDAKEERAEHAHTVPQRAACSTAGRG